MPQKDMIFSNKHPKEMYLLAASEICQRFAYWGIANLLVLFLIGNFSYTSEKAASFFGLFTGLTFLLPILGGYIGDKWNYKSPIVLGSVLSSIGSFLISTLTHNLAFLGLMLVALGVGLIMPSIYTLLGTLYNKRPHLREGGFSIYYALVNVGILLAMLLLGYIQTFSWRLVFLISGIVQLVGLFPYFIAAKRIESLNIPNHFFVSKAKDPNQYPLKKHEKDRIIVIIVMTLLSILFWLAYNQMGSSITLFINSYTSRTLSGFRIPTPWFLALEPFFLITFAFPLAFLYLFLRKIHSNASPQMKTALSLFFMGMCFVVMQRAAANIPFGATSASESPIYIILAFGLMALAELFLAPIGLSLVTNLSPHRYKGILTGIWFACVGVGYYLGGMLATLMNKITLSAYFDIFVVSSLIPAVVLVLFSKKLDNMRHIDYL